MEESKLNIYQKLLRIQSEVKVPKNLKNKFGNYNYRNLEQILKEAKPIAAKYGCAILTDDELKLVGNRYYICTTSTLVDTETGESVQAHGWARESENKTGMDASQITGASSSYAGKYSLGRLLGIDDGIDADSMDNREEGKPKPAEDPLAEVKKQIDECETVDELKGIWARGKDLQKNKDFVEYVKAKQVALRNTQLPE